MRVPLLLLVAALSAGPPKYNRWKNHRPYHANWGPYKIVVEQVGKDESGWPECVRIQDRKGHLLREIEDNAIVDVNTVELTGKPPAELHISTWTGGAYGGYTDVYFTREGGLHNILVFEGEDLGVREIKDLNHDGIPEIITDNPVLGDFSGYNFHRHIPLVTILGWNGKRYVDVTRQYPQRSLRQARALRQNILSALSSTVVFM